MPSSSDAAAERTPLDRRVPPYRIDDQFGHTHDDASALGTPALYVLARRDGVFTLARWAESLGTALAEPGAPRARVVPVIAIGNVPRLFRDAVRRLLPQEPRASALLDWDDTLGALRLSDAECTVALVDADGRVRHREAVGASAEPADVAALLSRVARLT